MLDVKKLRWIGGGLLSIVGVYFTTRYYMDNTRPNARSRVKTISQSMLCKQYHSVRDKDVQLIRNRLTLKPEELKNQFSVLVGPRGIGKTVAIETAAENIKGIISFA